MSAAPTGRMLLCSHSLVDPPHPGSAPRRAGDAPARTPSFREVVACVDGSPLGRGLVPHARAVAGAFGAQLTLVHVLEAQPATGGSPPDPLHWGIRQREAQAHLDELAAKAAGLESETRTELIQGRPAEQICAWAEHHEAALAVLCSHGERGLTEWDLASNARKLVERVPGSLLLVPAAVAAKNEDVKYQRILVPLDGSARAESVIPVAMRIAAAQDAELVLVNVVPVPEITRIGPLDAEGAELERRVIERNRRVAGAYLDRLRARASQAGCRVRVLVIGNGTARTRLVRAIREEGIDLVVMSAHGQSGRTDSSCGGVTEYALTHATVPLLVVRDRAARRIRRAGPSYARHLERPAFPGHASV